ncbi:MAG: mechanosensitive ion channel [Lachnospiraceae bacterium]|nr:mechanosensitive ion channel [Lachnospiraceae bacterium]
MALPEIAEEEIDIGLIEKFFAELPDKIFRLGIRVLLAIIVFLVGTRIIKIVRKMVKKSLLRGNAEQGVIQFLDSFIKAALYIILVLFIASGFGVDAASVVALLGSAGVAIGLAIQGSLSNLAGGVLILLLKPFKVGDYIKEDTNGNEGTVEEIQLFYTRLATPENKIIILPNGNLANSSLTNVTFAPDRRLDIKVGISYKADIRKAKDVLMEVLKKDAFIVKEKEQIVYVDELADSSVILGIRCWFKNEDYWEGKWRITENVKYALDENAIEIPYPQMDVHVDNLG